MYATIQVGATMEGMNRSQRRAAEVWNYQRPWENIGGGEASIATATPKLKWTWRATEIGNL